ncbi:MAG: Hsp20/alpha crystallin family protein [Opitutaceae bacterium]|nr:Hsp20/alpha crystallin family protein [Opitutaceae bacterium]MBP9913181.1 Hsp20/alpha crystallin family protein [Opitutaceae bacterium]
MHTIIHPLSSSQRSRPVEAPTQPHFRKPSYDCREQPEAVKLVVYVPGVEGAGIEIESRGPDIIITARKAHFVRVNWQALHLESAQRDYRLRLRLGHGLDYAGLQAAMHEGVLTLLLPKRVPDAPAARLQHVA